MSVHQSYANALFEVITEKKLSSEQLDQCIHELETFQNWLMSSIEAKKVFLGSMLQSKEKFELIAKISNKIKFSDLTSHFLQLVCRKNRISFLHEMIQDLKKARLAAEGGISGKLVTAEELNHKDIEELVKTFSHKLGKKITFQVTTDPSLLAGIQVTVNGVTYDGTLRSQLQRLKETFVS